MLTFASSTAFLLALLGMEAAFCVDAGWSHNHRELRNRAT